MKSKFRLVSFYILIFSTCLPTDMVLKAQFYKSDSPFAHTYSIVAFDEKTVDMGVAVQSHWFSVGTIVTWGEAGVGVVATQPFVNPAFGPGGLDLLRKGKSPQEAVDELLKSDEGREFRQLAILDSKGNAASFTGKLCIQPAGNIVNFNIVKETFESKPQLDNCISRINQRFLNELSEYPAHLPV